MPTYQYACTECGSQMEVVQSFSDDALTVCPECEGRLRKVYSAVGIVFKGSGFYRTDNGSASGASSSSAANGSNGSNGSGESTSGENGTKSGSESTPAAASSSSSTSGSSSESSGTSTASS